MNSRIDNEIKHGHILASDDAEHLWGWGSAAGQKRASRRADLIMAAAHIKPQDVVLEIGCGTGIFTEMFLKSKAQIVAVDLSADLLNIAKERILYDTQMQQLRFINLPFEKCENLGPFDAIIGSSILHHLDIDVSLKKIYSMLKHGGCIAFAEPNMLNPQVFIERKFRRFFHYVSPDETAFIRNKINKKLSDKGFTDILITPFDWLHPAVPEVLIKYFSKIGYVLEKIPLIREFSGSLLIQARKNIIRYEPSI